MICLLGIVADDHFLGDPIGDPILWGDGVSEISREGRKGRAKKSQSCSVF